MPIISYFAFLKQQEQGLSIRQSKSDSILLAYERFYSQQQPHLTEQGSFETLSNHQQRTNSVTFFCGADCDSPGVSVDSTMLTIEELRSYNKSCATCGVSWFDEHVSLDCSECGGYALERPCPQCDGQCHTVWRRDLDASHNTHKAKWEGVCLMRKDGQLQASRQNDNDVLVKALDKLATPLWGWESLVGSISGTMYIENHARKISAKQPFQPVCVSKIDSGMVDTEFVLTRNNC